MCQKGGRKAVRRVPAAMAGVGWVGGVGWGGVGWGEKRIKERGVEGRELQKGGVRGGRRKEEGGHQPRCR